MYTEIEQALEVKSISLHSDIICRYETLMKKVINFRKT